MRIFASFLHRILPPKNTRLAGGARRGQEADGAGEQTMQRRGGGRWWLGIFMGFQVFLGFSSVFLGFSKVFLGFSKVFLGFSKVYPGFAFLVIFYFHPFLGAF